MRIDPSQISREWLIEPMPSFSAEQAARYDLRRLGVAEEGIARMLATALPRAHERATEWEAFIALAEPGDALWYFSSPKESWGSLSGRSGFALVRAGAVIAAIVTAMS